MSETTRDGESVATALRLAAAGRAEYASTADPDHALMLRTEAACYETAAHLIEHPESLTGFLRGSLPSWRWDENGVGMEAPASGSKDPRP